MAKMTVDRIQEIRDTIDDIKDKRSRAEGKLEQILKTWKNDFDCDSVEEVEKKIVQIEGEIEGLKKKMSSLSDDIEKAADWDEIAEE
jgi:chromosome segregation ATPase